MAKFCKIILPALVASLAVFILGRRCAAASLHVRDLGDYLQTIIPSYAFGFAMGEQDYEAAKQFMYSFWAAHLTVDLLKSATKRKRPDYQPGDKKDSFPSGHTAAAFSGATFIHKRYGLRQAAIPYALATFVGYSRVDAKQHRVSDVAAGALISSFFTWVFVDRMDNFSIVPDGDGAKIEYKARF